MPFEGAVAGLPSVVTDVGAVTELLHDRRSALVVAPEDPGVIAGAIVELLADPELAARLAAAARELIDAKLRPEISLAGFKRAVELTLG